MRGFEYYPEFIETDTRELIEIENENIRHSFILDDILEGASILDLGSMMCASGAYALMNGAEYYEGVDVVKTIHDNAEKCMKEYFPSEVYIIHNLLFLDYFKKYNDSFDIVLLMNMFYYIDDQRLFLEEVAKRSKKYIVIESPTIHPVVDSEIPIVVYKSRSEVRKNKKWKDTRGIPRLTGFEEKVYCKLPNLAYFKLVLSMYGFKYLKDYHEYSIRMLPNRYNEENRFLAVFERIEE